MKLVLGGLLILGLMAGLLLGTGQGRDVLRALRAEAQWWQARRGTVRTEHRIEVPNAILATDLYLPKDTAGPLPTILLRLPYGKRRYAEVRWWLGLFGSDHAVVVQDMRGRFASTGTFEPWRHEAADGAATLDWIAAQEWSNGRVGTAGCSALGETQIALAARRHPAHAAMIALGAGGGVGDIDGRRNPFAAFQGGIPALALGAGWFGSEVPGSSFDLDAPVRDAVTGPGAEGWRALLYGFDEPGFAARMGYADEDSRFSTPALIVDGWFDAAVAESLSLTAAMRAQGVDAHALILPATHCDFAGGFQAGVVGDVAVRGDAPDLGALFRAFMSARLSDEEPPDLPPFRVWAMGSDRWIDVAAWPQTGDEVRLYLNQDTLGEAPGGGPWTFSFDPEDPLPSIGGAVCCTDAVDPGPRDQTAIEAREDVLVWTSGSLSGTILGAPEVTLRLRVDRPDADIVVRLTEVFDGRSVTVAEGALRLRYRNGWDAPQPLPDEPVEVTVPLSPIAWTLSDGALVRLHLTGSSFPRLAHGLAAEVTVLGGSVVLPMMPQGH